MGLAIATALFNEGFVGYRTSRVFLCLAMLAALTDEERR
jgi:hypothetical protein